MVFLGHHLCSHYVAFVTHSPFPIVRSSFVPRRTHNYDEIIAPYGLFHGNYSPPLSSDILRNA